VEIKAFTAGLRAKDSPGTASAIDEPRVTTRLFEVIADTGRRHAELRAGGSAQFNRPAHGEYAVKNLIVRFVREEAGQDLIEYALIATFVSIVAAVGATMLGTSLNAWYGAVSGKVDGMAGAVGS
jgi:Flp pilus assembly pilin Flp